MTVKRTRIRQLTLAAEETEGSAQTLTSSDVASLSIFDLKAPFEVPQFDRVPSKGNLSLVPKISGSILGNIEFGTDLKGSGSTNTAPYIGPMLEASGFQKVRRTTIAVDGGGYTYNEEVVGGTSAARGLVLKALSGAGTLVIQVTEGTFQSGETITGQSSATAASSTGAPAAAGFAYKPVSASARTIAIGAVTSGPFISGERVTGGTSSATGIVTYDCANGAAVLRFIPESGTFQSGETITGEVSGASATSSATPTCQLPTPTYTVGVNEDGISKVMKGTRGSFSVEFGQVGEPARVNFTMQGVPNANPVDAAQFAEVADSLTPPKFAGVTLSMGSYTPIISGMTLNVENTLSPRANATDSKGYESIIISGREIGGNFGAEMVDVAVEDFHGDWFSDATKAFNCVVGSTAGNIVEFYAPAFQTTNISDEDRDGIAVAGMDFMLNGLNGDDEIVLMFY